jgi:hypothetical protein
VGHQEALVHVGLTREIQEAITDPRFSHIFGTQTLVYCSKDTVETNYAALLGLLQSHASQRMAEPRHEQGPSKQQFMTATINMTPQDFQFSDAYVMVQPDANPRRSHFLV